MAPKFPSNLSAQFRPIGCTTLVKLHPIADKAGHLSEMVGTAPAEPRLDMLENVAQMFSPREIAGAA